MPPAGRPHPTLRGALRQSLPLLAWVPATALAVIALESRGRGVLAFALVAVAQLVLWVLALLRVYPAGGARLGARPVGADPREVDLVSFWRLSITAFLVLGTYSLTRLFLSADDLPAVLFGLSCAVAGGVWLMILVYGYHHDRHRLVGFRHRALELGRRALAAESPESAERLWLDAERHAAWSSIEPPRREMIVHLLALEGERDEAPGEAAAEG